MLALCSFYVYNYFNNFVFFNRRNVAHSNVTCRPRIVEKYACESIGIFDDVIFNATFNNDHIELKPTLFRMFEFNCRIICLLKVYQM